MKIDEQTAAAIGVALNEAALLGAEYDAEANVVCLSLSVLTLPDDDLPEPSDPRRQIVLTNVGRIVAALRESRWDDGGSVPPSCSSRVVGRSTTEFHYFRMAPIDISTCGYGSRI